MTEYMEHKRIKTHPRSSPEVGCQKSIDLAKVKNGFFFYKEKPKQVALPLIQKMTGLGLILV